MQRKERFIFLIGQARNRFFTKLDQALTIAGGVTAVQSAVLYYLVDNDGCQFVEMSRALLLDKSAVTGLIDRLEEKGLVARKPSPSDRRALNVYLTDAGRESARKCLTVTKGFNNKITEGMSSNDAAIFASALKKIISDFS